jgi:hypothetical protein
MKCPNPTCQSSRIVLLNTYPHDHPAGITAELRGLNLTRRRRRCEACKEVFHSIEVPEADFNHLRRKTGRLEAAQPSVRPGIGGRS